MVGLGAIFFCVVPTILLFSLTSIASVDAVEQISQTLEVLPDRAQASIEASTGGEEASPQGQASYALAVFLFAPVAVVVPLTISTDVGAATNLAARALGRGAWREGGVEYGR